MRRLTPRMRAIKCGLTLGAILMTVAVEMSYHARLCAAIRGISIVLNRGALYVYGAGTANACDVIEPNRPAYTPAYSGLGMPSAQGQAYGLSRPDDDIDICAASPGVVNPATPLPLAWEWLVIMPSSVPLLGFFAVLLLIWWRDRPFRRGHCQWCGYDLRGNMSGRCPECGTCTSANPRVA